MDCHALEGARWLVPAMFLVGCATSGRESYDSMRAAVDREGVVDRREQVVDDRALDGPSLERAAYVRAVLHQNRSIEAARQGWRAAIARVRQSGTLEDPMATLEVAPLSIGSSTVRLGYNAMISQRLPWPGKLSLEELAAKAEADAEKSDYETVRRELAFTASILYDDYFVAVRSIDINAQHIDLMRAMHGAATSQYETGRASAQDPLQAEFELTHMEHDAIVLATARDVTVAQMNELLHRAPDRPLPPPPKDMPVTVGPDPTESLHLQTEAIDHRPDIVSAREHARAQQAHAERAQRDYYPDVTVSSSYNSMWDMPEHRWMVGLSVNLPIQVGRRGGAVEEASASRAKFEADAARMSDMARTQVVVALKQLEESGHVLHIYGERLLPIARDEVKAARSAFTVSQAPFGAVVEAERNLRGVELDEQKARAENDRRRAELDRALGRIPGLDGKEDAR